MTQTSRGRSAPPDGADLAESRVRFLTAEQTKLGAVRGPILASWHRSRDLKVAADKIEMTHVSDLDIDTNLTEECGAGAARPA